MNQAYFWMGLALAALGHGFLWTGIVNRVHGWGGPRWLVDALTLVFVGHFAVLLPAAAWDQWRRHGTGGDLFALDSISGYYLWTCVAIGGASLVVKPWIESRRYDRAAMQRWDRLPCDACREIGRKPLVGGVAKFLGSLPGNEVLTPVIDRKRLALPGLPSGLNGLTICHLSDLHMTGRIDRDFYEYVVRRVNSLRPDVIAVTGDIVECERCWPWLPETLGKLCAPLGVYFVLGNHDKFIDVERTRSLLIDAGFTSLSSRWIRADWNGTLVTLLGNELPWIKPAEPVEPPPKKPGGQEFRIVLSHSPDQFKYAVAAEADLILAGHTHGGQVQLPWLGVITSPSVYGTRYACGVFRRNGTVMHVSRGLSGERLLRWRCPPEIALLELSTAQNSPR